MTLVLQSGPGSRHRDGAWGGGTWQRTAPAMDSKVSPSVGARIHCIAAALGGRPDPDTNCSVAPTSRLRQAPQPLVYQSDIW